MFDPMEGKIKKMGKAVKGQKETSNVKNSVE